MTTSNANVREQLREQVQEGTALVTLLEETKGNDLVTFGMPYQAWYTKSLPLVRALAPDRHSEFISYYEPDPKRKRLDILNCGLRDYVNGIAPASARGVTGWDHKGVAVARLVSQVLVLESLESRIDGVLAKVEGHLLADLEDRELRAAGELSKISPRAAGALAGVILERHLGQVASNRGIKLAKKDPTIGDLNEALKKDTIYDLPTYRKIQHMADIRNLCSHSKVRDPSGDEVDEQLRGVGALIKTVF